MESKTDIEAFSVDDKKEVLDLLKEAQLPNEDLTVEKMKNFMVARCKDGSIIGVVGVEMYHASGLLRSLVVHPSYRGKGLGSQLTRKIESYAWHRGVKTLYLLTMTAADFFPKIGYDVTQRNAVPESIAKTEEFKTVCPASAVCLLKALDFP